jgi:hypothetical protein
VQNHEFYEELCAAAAIGQASPEELCELEQHTRECFACRREYASYLELAARQFACNTPQPELSIEEARACLNSDQITARFFERAGQEGITFSPSAAELGKEDSHKVEHRIRMVRRSPRTALVLVPSALAAALLMAVLVLHFKRAGAGTLAPLAPTAQVASTFSNAAQLKTKQFADLEAARLALQAKTEALTADLRDKTSQLAKMEQDAKSTGEDRRRLQEERNQLAAELDEARKKLADSQDASSTAKQEIARLHERDEEQQATLVADRVHIQDLTEQLAQKSTAMDDEHQLLAAGHDITDLMGARNLHIVDVADTDAQGKSKPAFGRIFYTEGKSLIFYAYDLNEAKLVKANYQYRIWAKKEGQDAKVQHLGIFYADDKAQRRWAFKCNDPKVLKDIDSVFVTLEPASSAPSRPKGQNLMYAYLLGQPNHP